MVLLWAYLEVGKTSSGIWANQGLFGVSYIKTSDKVLLTSFFVQLNISMQGRFLETIFKNTVKQRIPDDPYTALADNKSYDSLMWSENG